MNQITFQIIKDTMEQMTMENGGELIILENIRKIARRAEVSPEVVIEYLKEILS